MSAVIQAAVAAANNTNASVLDSSVANPFKRWRHTLDEEPITEETPLSRSESAERRAAEGLRIETHGYGSVSEPSVQREVRGGWRNSNPPPKDALLEMFRRAPGADEGYGGGENNGRNDLEDNEVGEDVYVLTETPYHRLVRLFSLVPLTAFLTILFFILLLHNLWPEETRSTSFTFYLGLFVFAAAAWVVSFALRIPLYLVSFMLCRFIPACTPFLSTILQVLVEEALRLCSLILVHIRLQDDLRPSDSAFAHVWVLSFGWAATEVAMSVYQGYEQLSLYKDVMSPDDSTASPHRPFPNAWTLDGHSPRPASADTQESQIFDDPEGFMNKEIDQLTRIRARIELEELYGIPVPNIPVFISCLLRIDSIILSLALYLLISSSYLSNLSASAPSTPVPHTHQISQAIRHTLPTFFIIVALHTFISFIWTANVLPRIGIHGASYLGCILALGALFTGLGRWDAV